MSISTNGYVCLGDNSACNAYTSLPSPYNIIVGYSVDLDSTRSGSGQIYYLSLTSGTSDFTTAKGYVNLLNAAFNPTSIFQITYDGVLPFDNNNARTDKASFQIWLFSDGSRYYSVIKYTSLTTTGGNPGLEFLLSSGSFSLIPFTNPLTSSNVGSTGIWVYETTSASAGRQENNYTLFLNLPTKHTT